MINKYRFFLRNYYIIDVFLYHALLIHLTLIDAEDLGLSSIVILLKHPVIFKLNIINKNNKINFFKSITSNSV